MADKNGERKKTNPWELLWKWTTTQSRQLSDSTHSLFTNCRSSLPPLLPPSLIRVCVGGGARLAVKHLSLLWFWIFFFPISSLSSHWSCFLSRIQHCLSVTGTNTPPLHSLPSLHPSAYCTCLLPIETRVILSSFLTMQRGWGKDMNRAPTTRGRISNLHNIKCQNKAAH